MIHIPNYTFTNLVQINKGWSADKKYCATDNDGIKYFLRTSTPERYERRKSIYEITKRAMQLDITVNQPIDFGKYENGVYTLFDWIDGEDLKTVLPSLTETEQYKLGFEAGEILQKIHEVEILVGIEQKLDSACRIVVYGFCDLNCHCAHFFS